jgi:ribosomal protein S18
MPENNTEQTVAPTEAGTPAAKKPAAGKTVAGKGEPAKSAAVSKPPVVKPATAKPPTKPNRLDETKAKNKKALADALAKAQAVKLAKPPSPPPVAKPKVTKAAKAKKSKLVRHAFSMPEVEYAQVTTLKKRIASLGGNVKRSELLRAGLALLAVLDNVELTDVMARIDRIKTGRPAKKG